MKFDRFYEIMIRGLESHVNIDWRISADIIFLYDIFDGDSMREGEVNKFAEFYKNGIDRETVIGEINILSINR